MTRFLSKYLSPSQITRVYMVLALVGIVFVTVFFSSVSEKAPKERVEKPVSSVLLERNTREIGLDAVNQKVVGMQSNYKDLTKSIEQIKEENKDILVQTKSSEVLVKELAKAKSELLDLQNKVNKDSAEQDQKIKEAVNYALKELNISKQLNGADSSTSLYKPKDKGETDSNGNNRPTPVVRRKLSPTDSVFSYNGNDKAEGNRDVRNPVSAARSDERAPSLFKIVEDENESIEDEEEQLYLPMGSMLTGVLLTGIDAPTDNKASDQPMPVLIRIKKEAVLPNYNYVDEVRECFALMAGYGDMSSERVYLRGEGVSCVKENGEVIETEFAAYATGEDGKAGLKGTLVSRNGKVLANAMMAGFAEGLSGMFDTRPETIIDSDGQVTFGSSNAVSGLASGGESSMSKLSEYFMSIADATFPVIELGAGRVLTIVVTKGTTL